MMDDDNPPSRVMIRSLLNENSGGVVYDMPEDKPGYDTAGPSPKQPNPGSTSSVEEELGAEKTRNEIAKLNIEIQELKAWRWKVILTALTPIGSVFLFLLGWYGSHLTERRQQNQELYTRAAKELASQDATVRLSGVKAIDTYIDVSKPGLFGTISQLAFSSTGTAELERERKLESMALIVGSLSHENDPAVLEAIADEVAKHPEESVDPLISANKAAAVRFARAAGMYSGLSVLHLEHAKFYPQDRWAKVTERDGLDPTISDLDVVTLRTGSPFEGSDTYNQRFLAINFLTNGTCPFKELFDNQQTLTMGSDLNDHSRVNPPTPKELAAALVQVIDAAAVLERSSYILGSVAKTSWSAIETWHSEQHKDLFGTAVIVGKPGKTAEANLRSLGGYFNSTEDNPHNPGCIVPSNEPSKRP